LEPRIVILASRNRDKLRELSALFAALPLVLKAAADLPGVPEVEEDAPTLEANALKKARAVAAATGELSLADDTGLEVDALGGAPGVHAARYAGPAATYAGNCRKLLAALDQVPAGRRAARFRTVMALVDPSGRVGERIVDGTLEGQILTEARGRRGFGYDPVFYVPSLKRTLAELEPDEKNRISHRAVAARRMLEELRAILVGA
jgi:XTP/dITP diphosphohydrolase